MNYNKEKLKMLIELSNTIEEVDEIFKNYTNYNTYETKIAFLNGLFNFEITSRTDLDLKTDYICIVNAIIKYNS